MLSIFFKSFVITFLAVGGSFIYRFPEQSVVLLFGVGLTAFAVVMRYRHRRTPEEHDKGASV